MLFSASLQAPRNQGWTAGMEGDRHLQGSTCQHARPGHGTQDRPPAHRAPSGLACPSRSMLWHGPETPQPPGR